MTAFETARLRAETELSAHLDDIYHLLRDPETMRYIAAPVQDLLAAQERVAIWAEYAAKRPGLGALLLFSKTDGDFVGICVARQVAYDLASTEYEIGYMFMPKHWGKGFASELVPVLSDYCLAQSGAKYLVAFTDPDNAASQHVLRKNGFIYAGQRQTAQGSSAEFRYAPG
jgi:RimJ/RimL family protein N-acetyltransferase